MDRTINIAMTMMVLSLSLALIAGAEESTLEKADTVKNQTIDILNTNARKIDEQICETVNGKMKCVSKKVKNKIKNAADKLKTNTTEIINKVD